MAQIIAIAMLAAALGGLYPAYQQHRTERAKLRLDAYPKQIEVFRCTESFLSRTWTGDYAYMPALLAEFHDCTKEARFLFDKEMADYLDSVYEGVARHFDLVSCPSDS